MLKKRIGVVMYQTSKSKGQELVAQRMVLEFNKIGHEAYLITSIYHDGNEVISPKGLQRTGGYTVIEDSDLHIPVIRVDSYVARWPLGALHSRILCRRSQTLWIGFDSMFSLLIVLFGMVRKKWQNMLNGVETCVTLEGTPTPWFFATCRTSRSLHQRDIH